MSSNSAWWAAQSRHSLVLPRGFGQVWGELYCQQFTFTHNLWIHKACWVFPLLFFLFPTMTYMERAAVCKLYVAKRLSACVSRQLWATIAKLWEEGNYFFMESICTVPCLTTCLTTRSSVWLRGGFESWIWAIINTCILFILRSCVPSQILFSTRTHQLWTLFLFAFLCFLLHWE